MKLNVFKSAKTNTTYLQGFGHVEGTPAGELKIGNTIVWNNGTPSTVVAIVKETDKTITILEEYEDRYSATGYSRYERKLLKSRIVARPVEELTTEPTEISPSGFTAAPQEDDRLFDRFIPSQEEEVPSESRNEVVLVTEGPDVDLVTDLFDRTGGNAKEVDPSFVDQISQLLAQDDNAEEKFDELAGAYSPTGGNPNQVSAYLSGKWTPPQDARFYPEYYDNQVTFDRIGKGKKVVGIEEFYSPKLGWLIPGEVLGNIPLTQWEFSDQIQYLKDEFEAEKFCLLVQDEDGRVKNPDFNYEDLIVNLEEGDKVLYYPDYVERGDWDNPEVEIGVVKSVKVEDGRSKVFVTFTIDGPAKLTPLSNLEKMF